MRLFEMESRLFVTVDAGNTLQAFEADDFIQLRLSVFFSYPKTKRLLDSTGA